jgi:DNA-binding response OmpR family regulator
MKPRILIVAEDAAFRATLARWLLNSGYAVELAESARRAREVAANETIALAIVAPHGTGSAGTELAREIGERVGHLLLVVESAGKEAPVASAGSLSWPCSEQDLLARVRSELANVAKVAAQDAPTSAAQDAPQHLSFDGYTLDTWARICLDAKGQEVTLTRAEFSLLLAFARQPGRILSRDELTHVVAGRGAEPDDRSIDVLISRLRRKIEPNPRAPRIILTIPGTGYQFVARPQAVATDPATAASSPATADVSPTKEALDGGVPAQRPQDRGTGRKNTPRSTRMVRAVVAAAAIILIAGLGREVWINRAGVPQATGVTPMMAPPNSQPFSTASQPGGLEERRAAVFGRMVTAMKDDRFGWRTVERLAIESGVDEAEAHEILAEHPGEVVLGKSRDGKLIARLADR